MLLVGCAAGVIFFLVMLNELRSQTDLSKLTLVKMSVDSTEVLCEFESYSVTLSLSPCGIFGIELMAQWVTWWFSKFQKVATILTGSLLVSATLGIWGYFSGSGEKKGYKQSGLVTFNWSLVATSKSRVNFLKRG